VARRIARLAAAVLAAVALVVSAAAQPAPPALTAPVNDFAGVIDPASAASLDRLTRALQAASGDVVVVATVKTFQPWGDIQSYATKMFENAGRGIGQKGKDNGLLVLLAVDDRQVRLEVGYDLEGVVTDGFAGETSRQVIAPYYRQGQYGPGLLAGTSRVIERIAADRRVTVTGLEVREAPQRTRDPISPRLILLALVVFFVVLPALNPRRRPPEALVARRRGPLGRRLLWRHLGRRFVLGRGSWGGGSSGGFGGFGGGRSGGGGGGASW
jgi:uncharacterized protein